MKAEALVGTVLGTCTLQQLIGRGSMAAVFLAQQSQPTRQVAVKVLMPMTSAMSSQGRPQGIAPTQDGAPPPYLERFRREANVASSLKHPNILPVYEYGEKNALPYLVMPYISGGTLRDELSQKEALPFSKVVDYLEQLAAALDFAHERGMIHRDIKPANVLKTPEGRLLLTDFGLVKILGQSAQTRLTSAGTPMGTPDYIAPEQILGSDKVDGRADLYSLGVILYQMVTARPPFQGQTPMEVVVQHLQLPPPSPRSLRLDLPVAAEQVILRALAKRPEDRYTRAQDLSAAFRVALTAAKVPLEHSPGTPGASHPLSSQSSIRTYKPRSLFDPSWQTGAIEAVPSLSQDQGSGKQTGILPPTEVSPSRTAGLLSGYKTGTLPPVGETRVELSPSKEQGSSKPTGILPPTEVSPGRPQGIAPTEPLRRGSSGILPLPIETSPAGPRTDVQSVPGPLSPLPATTTTGALQAPGPLPAPQAGHPVRGTGIHPPDGVPPPDGAPSPGERYPQEIAPTEPLQGPHTDRDFKPTGVMKVVRVPVAGQTGRYVTTVLPVLPETPRLTEPSTGAKSGSKKRLQMIAVVVAVLLVLFGAGGSWLAYTHFAHHSGTKPQAGKATVVAGTPDLQATTAAKATATASANIILMDPLRENINDWPISQSGSKIYVFKDGAYHITNNDNTQSAIAILPDRVLSKPISYSLTLEEIQGNDKSLYNTFGMIMRFSTQTQGNSTITRFYIFEVVNMKGGEYQFWKFDNSKGKSVSPWTMIWDKPFGKEFHQGHGPQTINTIRIVANGKSFTFIVNGKQVGAAFDGSITSGQVGMMVNLKGTEVAFSDLELMYV